MLSTNTLVAINNATFNFYSRYELSKCDWAPKFGA